MGNISILLADDSITIQKVVGIIFASDGYTLTVVDNGKAALLKAREIQPDVILVDAIMPDMNGYEVCSEIRKDPSLAGKPLLLLTGSFEPFDEQKAKDCGADDHIVKPFESQQLIAKVKELYELGCNRAVSASSALSEPEPETSRPVEEEPVFTTFIESPAIEASEPESAAFIEEPMISSAILPESIPVEEPALVESDAADAKQMEESKSRVSPDDPWGAYSTTVSEPDVADVFMTSAENMDIPAAFEPDVMEIVSQEPVSSAAPEIVESAAPSSWTPVEEQTFEFKEEVVEAPSALTADIPAEAAIPEAEAAFNPTAFEPIATVEPVVENVAEVPHEVAPVLTEPPVAMMSEDQIREILLSASKETIERIVWEVVPDLAETMIREAIRRITEIK